MTILADKRCFVKKISKKDRACSGLLLLGSFLLYLNYLNRLHPLKKLVSIFFLVIFLFNVGGYYLVFWMMEKQANQKLLERLEANHYSDEETMVLTIPLTMPYPIYQNDYERVDGEFEYQGEQYKLVKQKLENDTLFIICIQNQESKKISAVRADFSKLTNNLPAGSKQALNFLAKLFKDFASTSSVLNTSFKCPLLSEATYYEVEFNLSSLSLPVDSPPPQTIS